MQELIVLVGQVGTFGRSIKRVVVGWVGSTTQAAPPHTRQDAEADFLGGLIGGGDALSHSQNAMEFCRTRQPSTC